MAVVVKVGLASRCLYSVLALPFILTACGPQFRHLLWESGGRERCVCGGEGLVTPCPFPVCQRLKQPFCFGESVLCSVS